MTKVLLTTNHPAPYINRWIEKMNLYYDTDVLYYAEKAKVKAWKKFSPYQGEIISKMGFVKLTNYVSHADLVILGGWNNLYYFAILVYGLFTKRKIALFSDYPKPQKKNLKYFIKRIVFKNCFSAILCATQSSCQFYASIYGIDKSKLFVFPYMSMDVIEQDAIAMYWTKRMKQISDGDRIRIFIANNFYERKGYETIFKAFRKLKNENLLSRFSIKIAGVGEDLEKYKEVFHQLDSEIIFLDWIEDEEYTRTMLNTDVFIHASIFEPFGIPPIDAMKCGKVLVCSKGIKSVEGIIEDGSNGYDFNPKDDDKLYKNLCSILQHRNELEQIGTKAKEEIYKYYNENTIIESINKTISLEK
jgi:glycosyltransferase involved in cell wall biosynthesis